MAALELIAVAFIGALGVLLALSLAVLIKKGDYRSAIRFGGAFLSGFAITEAARSLPETPHLFALLRKLSIVPLVVSIAITLPVVRRAWALLRGGSSAG